MKTVKSPYLRNRLTDFGEIWHGDADWPPTGDTPLKFRIFQKTRWRRSSSWKTTQIAISQRIDRSLRNLAWLCKMGLLSAQTVKKFEFPKSKMADGWHCEIYQNKAKNLCTTPCSKKGDTKLMEVTLLIFFYFSLIFFIKFAAKHLLKIPPHLTCVEH